MRLIVTITKSNKNMTKNIRKMYTYIAKNLITVAMYKCVLKCLRLSQRDIKIPLPSQIGFTIVTRRQELMQFMV